MTRTQETGFEMHSIDRGNIQARSRPGGYTINLSRRSVISLHSTAQRDPGTSTDPGFTPRLKKKRKKGKRKKERKERKDTGRAFSKPPSKSLRRKTPGMSRTIDLLMGLKSYAGIEIYMEVAASRSRICTRRIVGF